VSVYPEQGPSDRDSTGEITFGTGEGIGGSSGFEDEESEEDEDLGPDSCGVGRGVTSESFESGEEYEDGRPAVVEGEGEVNEDCE
jgi:hypothetical protein